jgi:hypothetical protein
VRSVTVNCSKQSLGGAQVLLECEVAVLVLLREPRLLPWLRDARHAASHRVLATRLRAITRRDVTVARRSRPLLGISAGYRRMQCEALMPVQCPAHRLSCPSSASSEVEWGATGCAAAALHWLAHYLQIRARCRREGLFQRESVFQITRRWSGCLFSRADQPWHWRNPNALLRWFNWHCTALFLEGIFSICPRKRGHLFETKEVQRYKTSVHGLLAGAC